MYLTTRRPVIAAARAAAACACCLFCYETLGIDIAFWGSLLL